MTQGAVADVLGSEAHRTAHVVPKECKVLGSLLYARLDVSNPTTAKPTPIPEVSSGNDLTSLQPLVPRNPPFPKFPPQTVRNTLSKGNPNGTYPGVN